MLKKILIDEDVTRVAMMDRVRRVGRSWPFPVSQFPGPEPNSGDWWAMVVARDRGLAKSPHFLISYSDGDRIRAPKPSER